MWTASLEGQLYILYTGETTAILQFSFEKILRDKRYAIGTRLVHTPASYSNGIWRSLSYFGSNTTLKKKLHGRIEGSRLSSFFQVLFCHKSSYFSLADSPFLSQAPLADLLTPLVL